MALTPKIRITWKNRHGLLMLDLCSEITEEGLYAQCQEVLARNDRKICSDERWRQFMRYVSLLIGLIGLVAFDDLSDPVTGLADGLYGSLTPVALGLTCLCFLFWGLSPVLLRLVKLSGDTRLVREIKPGITLIDGLAGLSFLLLGLMFVGAHIVRLFGG